MEDFTQQDAHEFFTLLMEYLDEQVQKCPAHPAIVETSYRELFCSPLEKHFTCHDCCGTYKLSELMLGLPLGMFLFHVQ